MINIQGGVSVLNKLQVSTKDVISYLESLNVANEQIVQVLTKEPSLPGYKYLPWFIDYSTDKDIVQKLKKKENLNNIETVRLKLVLFEALRTLKKGHSNTISKAKFVGLQSYLDELK